MVHRPSSILLLVLLVTLAALYPVSRLSIRTDIVSLVPEGSPAATGYRTFLQRFGGLEQVFVLVLPAEDGADPVHLGYAAALLANELAARPEVREARAGIEAKDEEFFAQWIAPRGPLLLGEDWRRIVAERIEPRAIADRVTWLRSALSTPAGAFQTLLAPGDPLGFTEELSLSSAGNLLPLEPFTTTFQARRGRGALVILTPSQAEMDPEGGRRLAGALEASYAEVRRQVDEVELTFHALGGPLYAAQDETVLRRDLQTTLTASLALTTAFLVLAFGGWRLPLTVLLPLLVGLVWTAAGAALLWGEISAVSIGFAAVLVGLGVDYGIHGGTHFRQTYLQISTGDAPRALRGTLRHVAPPVLTSALTTAVGFAVLGFAHLPPLRELGALVTLGILTILVAMAVAGSAGWVLVAPRLGSPGRLWHWLGEAGNRLPRLASHHPRPVLAIATLATLLAIPVVGGLSVDPDVRTLRPDNHPAHRAEELLVERFGIGVDTATVVIPGEDLPAALTAARAATEHLRRVLPSDLLARKVVTSPTDLLPAGEPLAERLRRLAALPLERAADDLERHLAAANLNPEAFRRGIEGLRSLGRGEDPGFPPVDAWPDWLRQSVRLDDDGAWVAIRLRLPPETWPDGPPAELIARLRAIAPGATVASAVAIGEELRSLAIEDLRALGLLALALVVLTVTISFRGRVTDTALAGLPVILGCLWTLALWAALGRDLDLFSLAVFPILLGVGIDDGLHVVHGARRDPEAGVRGSLRVSCRALVLTTLTTCAGFGSLVLSSIPGLRNGGALIAVGVVACLLATLLVLPALDALRHPSRSSER